MGQVTTMEITYAARDSSFDGNAIQAGDYLLLVDNQLFGTEKSMETALEKLAQESQERGGEFISIFYGEGVQRERRNRPWPDLRPPAPRRRSPCWRAASRSTTI